MFDYKGYDNNTILDLCDEKNVYRGIVEWKYWTSEVYSFGNHIRDYGFYPKIFPLYVYSNHGVICYYEEHGIPLNESDHDAEYMFCFNSDSSRYYKEKTGKSACCLMSPFVWYRKKNKITQVKDAKGTLAFPAHTTPDLDLVSSMEDYIQQLKNLPNDFQPVAVCLHMHDVNKGQHEIFLKHGIPVYTAGNAFDFRFAERLYDILKHFKYTTSNLVGSYAFYSIEMGIPFSIYGDDPVLVNNADPNLAKGEYKFNERKAYKEAYEMFKGLNTKITAEQREYVEKSLGVNEGISRLQLAKILYGSYYKRGNLLKDLIFGLKNHLKVTRKKIKRRLNEIKKSV